MCFNTEATSWLGVYLDTGLQFRAHKNLRLEKARRAGYRVRGLAAIRSLAPGFIRRIKVTIKQAVTLYRAEIW